MRLLFLSNNNVMMIFPGRFMVMIASVFVISSAETNIVSNDGLFSSPFKHSVVFLLNCRTGSPHQSGWVGWVHRMEGMSPSFQFLTFSFNINTVTRAPVFLIFFI